MYIVEVDSQRRESEAIRHIVSSFHKDWLLRALGFDDLTWVIVEAQKPKLTPGIVGDVDILAGNLDFKDWSVYRNALAEIEAKYPHYPQVTKTQFAGKTVSEAGGLKWPPEPVFVAGIEVKCAYFTDNLRASKSSEEKIEGIRKQIAWLDRMGLDERALLDVIGNEPAYEESGGFLGALERANRSLQAATPILNCRLAEHSTAGHFVWAVGSVGGGDEGMRGAGGLLLLRQPQRNPLLEAKDPRALEHRSALLSNIPKLLVHLPAPFYFPVVFLDCLECEKIHYFDDPLCPWNGRSSRW
jgi:hypothetical protein